MRPLHLEWVPYSGNPAFEETSEPLVPAQMLSRIYGILARSCSRAASPLQGRLNRNGREFEDFLVLQVGVGSAVSASLARQIENAVDWPDRVEGAGVAALERHLARPVVVDPVLVA